MRLDPLNWIIRGRLGFEIEVGIVKWMSVETVPVFVTTESPPWLNLNTDVVKIRQSSEGLGPLAGASLGVNFWLSGKAMKGYALSTGITNYTIRYESRNSEDAIVDHVEHTERNFYFMFGSLSRWGAFAIAGGIGFGYDMNNETRCFGSDATRATDAEIGGDCGAINLALQERSAAGPFVSTPVTDFIYPWSLLARFSLGFVID